MPAPTQKALKKSLSALRKGLPPLQKDFFNMARAFAFQPGQDQFLLEIGALNKKLAETLIVFRKRLSDAAVAGEPPEAAIAQAFLHYIVNTDGPIPEAESDDPFDVLEAAGRYADLLGVGLKRQEDGAAFLEVDDKKLPVSEWGARPGRSAAWSLREIGPAINRARYGRDAVAPPFAFGFDENAEGHSLPNALALADFSHLAYFGPAYVEKQLSRWGYGPFQWAEDKKTDTQAFVAGKDAHLIVCFRGTSSGKDALVDTRFLKTSAFGGRGRVHRGFNKALDSVWGQLEAAAGAMGDGKKLFLSGHSLGAALAQLAAHRFALEGYPVAGIYVYGSPRIGDPEYRDVYNELLEAKTFLHINNKDIVARIPPRILGFRHLGGGPRLFDEGHAISILPKPKGLLGEEEEMAFEELDEAAQQEILEQLRDAQRSVEAEMQFLNTPPELPEDARSKGLFDIRPVDDHSMNEYLFKFGCAVVDGEWERVSGLEDQLESPIKDRPPNKL